MYDSYKTEEENYLKYEALVQDYIDCISDYSLDEIKKMAEEDYTEGVLVSKQYDDVMALLDDLE